MKKRDSLSTALIAVLFGVLVLLAWQFGLVHLLLRLKPYQLPVPSAVFLALKENFSEVMRNARTTMTEAVAGIAIGSAIGYLVALLNTIFPKWGRGGLMLVTAINAVPMIAMAPIMNNWFGMYLMSKVMVVAMFSMAAMAINAYHGMTVLKPFARDLMSSYAASPFAVFWKLRMPNSIPNVLTALKINTTSGLMAAICSEFFTSSSGLGFQMSALIKLSQMSLAWAYILTASVCGILMYAAITIVEHFSIRWHESQR